MAVSKIQLRRDSAADWTSNNPTMSLGEFGHETDTSKFKVGDGSTAWTSLGYVSDVSLYLPLAGGTVTGTINGPSGSWDDGGMDLASGDSYAINATDVLTETTLGGAVVNSSLTSLGTITSLVATTADINGGTFDGIVGGTTPAAGDFDSVNLADAKHILIGSDDDTDLSHSGADFTLINNTGGLYIQEYVNSGIIYLRSRDSGGTTKVGIAIGAATPNVSLYHNGVKSISTQSGGIAFSTDTAAANTLDDYEEGTWTPVITDLTNDASMSIQVGSYEKHGRKVSIKARLSTSSLGSVSGAISVSGLPFTTNGDTNSHSSISIDYGINLAITAGESLAGFIGASSTSIDLRIWNIATGVSQLQESEWSADGAMMLSGYYYV